LTETGQMEAQNYSLSAQMSLVSHHKMNMWRFLSVGGHVTVSAATRLAIERRRHWDATIGLKLSPETWRYPPSNCDLSPLPVMAAAQLQSAVLPTI